METPSNLDLFLIHFLGNQPWPWWLAVLIWALVGCLVNLYLYAVNTRNKYSPDTPQKFSVGFLMMDNIQRLFIGFIVSFIFIRFSVELIGSESTIYLGLVYGLVSDKLASFLSKLEVSARQRNKDY